jgi:ubiquinone/menaquinone biosynthesis C-methylase UbiE
METHASHQVFETQADRYEGWFERHAEVYQSELNAVRAALDRFPPGGRGLDIGTGTGRFAVPFGVCEGIEPATAMRQLAEVKGMDVRAGVAEALPYSDEQFDFALMITTICFLTDPLQGCREAWRVLKPGGSLIIGLVDRDSPLGRFYDASRAGNPFYQHARFHRVPEVVELMSSAGFRELDFQQTLFDSTGAHEHPDPVLPSYGRGGFVVVSGRKPSLPT